MIIARLITKMCNKRNASHLMLKGRRLRIDSCFKMIIENLNLLGLETVACCCGHGRYPSSILIKSGNRFAMNIFSGRYFNSIRKIIIVQTSVDTITLNDRDSISTGKN